MAYIRTKNLVAAEQPEICKLLIKADYTVRLATLVQNGKKVKAIECRKEGKNEQRANAPDTV